MCVCVCGGGGGGGGDIVWNSPLDRNGIVKSSDPRKF